MGYISIIRLCLLCAALPGVVGMRKRGWMGQDKPIQVTVNIYDMQNSSVTNGVASSSGVDFAGVDFGAKPKICDEHIVEETCLQLNGLDEDTDSAEADGISAGVLEEVLSADKQTIEDLWKTLQLPANMHAECSVMCWSIVKYVKENAVLPPSSDISCYNIDGETHCDVDVSLDQLPRLGPKEAEDIPDFHDAEFLGKKTAFLESERLLNGTDKAPSALVSLTSSNEIEYGTWELVERVANLFRIYPTEKPDTQVQAQGRSATSWSEQQRRLNAKKMEEAKAYMGIVIRAFNAKQTQTQMTRWFGSSAFSDTSTRKEILRVLNSVDHMISSVDFVFPGPQCQSNVYAYVYPQAYTCSVGQLKSRACTKTDQGKLVFYLCPFYFTRESEMVETLVHEGSHHASAFTDDVNFNGRTAYGRGACQKLAKARPSLALKNADSFCYYIQDTATQVGTGGNGGGTPPPATPPRRRSSSSGSSGSGARYTVEGCRCSQEWSASHGALTCQNSCCNPDNDPNGDWCAHAESCGSKTWGYCAGGNGGGTPPRRRSSGGSSGSGVRSTVEGCRCKERWSSSQGACENYCCNPDNDPNGKWCAHAEDCGDSNWGYCA